MTIAESEVRDKWYGFDKDWVLVGIIVLSSALCFGLGLLAGKSGIRGSKGELDNRLWIEQLPAVERAATSTSASAVPAAKSAPATSTTQPASPLPAAVVTATDHTYVASKSGTKYYLPSCGTVSRIKEENRVWFATKADAEKAGYEPSTSCKGL